MDRPDARDRRRHTRWLGLPLVLALAAAVAGAAPAQTAPKGIDVSHWQGQISWVQVGASGYGFAFAKATEGKTFTDATYPLNRSGAGAAGMRVGAYHFARPTGTSDAAVAASAIAQADYFLAFAQPRRGDLVPVLDLEKSGGLSSARLTAWTQAWLDQLAARLGVKPVIYASPSFWKTALGDTPIFALAGNRLWIAHWTKAGLPILPGAGWGGLGWTFWQWTDCVRVPGIVNCVDGDRFNGATIAPGTIPAYPSGTPVAGSPPLIVGTPQTGRLLAATSGDWDGGKPVSFGYQWQTCDAVGAGCTPIAGAVKQSYTPTAVDVGHALVVSITAQTAGGTAVANSPATLAVASSGTPAPAAPAATTPPTIQGTAQVGQTLSALVGTWTGSPTAFAYQWRRCATNGAACAAIPGAGATSYMATPDDIGASLSLVVTATGKGGSRSATTPATAVVAPAPVPAPVVGSAIAQPGQAGAVTTADHAVTATWQPGAVPPQATVRLGSSASRLALRGTAVSLGVSAAAPLPWPIDVQYSSAPADAVPGFLRGKGVWQPVAELRSPSLPAGQEVGTYRDASDALHVLTRNPGRIALFAPGKWGDPRLVSSARPSLTLVSRVASARRADRSILLRCRFTLDSQAHLYASVVGPGGRKALLPRRGSRVGRWLKGRPTKILHTLQLRPGALPVRVRVPARQLRAKGRYVLRIEARDPYRRRSRLIVSFSATR
jgi:GH25 family lysozyme M1 (1,4-beta-N-acetylmuramidase)